MIPGESPHETVPDDVFLIVFSLLDVTDLSRCTQVCRRFHRLVETDASLQYRIELIKNGMVNGPVHPGSMGTGDRLVNLRAYNARLHRGEYSCVQDCSLNSDAAEEAPWELMWSTGASVAYVNRKAGKYELVLSVPPVSHVEDVQRGRDVIVPLDDFGPDALVATDYTQDLLVGVRKRIEDCSDFQIRIGSLKDEKIGHPLANNAFLATSAFDQFVQHVPADVHAIRIYSQYVFLVVFVDRMGPYEFQIWDWKTSTPLMRTIVATTGTPRFTLIDNAHFAVIGSRDSQISVYRFISDAERAGSAYPQFKLTLPGAGVRMIPNMPPAFLFIHDISVSLPLSPAQDSGTPGAFAMNPDAAILMIEYTTVTGLAGGNYLLLVPTSSIRKAMLSAYSAPQLKVTLECGEWCGDAFLLDKRQPEKDMSWIYPVAHGRAYGSRMPVLVYPNAADTTVGQVFIVEMDPWASRHATSMMETENQEPAGAGCGALALLQDHIRLHIYGHRLRPNYAFYRGPLISLPRGIEPDGIVLDEHGVSILFAQTGPDGHNNDMIRGFQTWALV